MDSNSGTQKEAVIGDEDRCKSPQNDNSLQEFEDNFQNRQNVSKDPAVSKSGSPPRKKKKIIRKVKENVVQLNPTEKLAEAAGEHIGIPISKTFGELSFYEKETIGHYLEILLGKVSNGSLLPLMHHTLTGELLTKLVLGRGPEFLAEMLANYFDISCDAQMWDNEKENIGHRLCGLLNEVAGGALVPLLNSTLTLNEVGMLSNLEEIFDHADIARTPKDGSPPKKRRKIVCKKKDDVEFLKAKAKLANTIREHIGISVNQTFDDLTFDEKETAGHHLKTLLDEMSSGSLHPLMHHTLEGDLIKKLVLGKGLEFVAVILRANLGISSDTPFPLMRENEKEDIGHHLGSLLRQVLGGALVPLFNITLNVNDVRELCNLKKISQHDEVELNGSEGTIDDEEMRERMATLEASADISNSRTQDYAVDSLKNLCSKVIDSLGDEVVLHLIKEVAHHDAPLPCLRYVKASPKTYPPLRLPRLSPLAYPKYNNDFIIDVISKISNRFERLAHDKLLWEGTVIMSLDGDELVDEETDEWVYGEKRADKLINEWLHDGTERLWLDGGDLVKRVPTFNFDTLAKRCPNLKTLLLYSVELVGISSPFRMASLEDLFMDKVNLVHSDAFLSFDWQLSFPSIKFFGMKPDDTEHVGCWSVLPNLRECRHIREVYLIGGGRYFFPTNILTDVPYPRGMQKLFLQHHGLSDCRWWGKKDVKILSQKEVLTAVTRHAPNCWVSWKDLGSGNAVCHRIRETACLMPSRQLMQYINWRSSSFTEAPVVVGTDDPEYEDEEERQKGGRREKTDVATAPENTPKCEVCGAEVPRKTRCGGCRR